MASRGTRILVKDGDKPIAQLGPAEAEGLAWHEKLGREGRLRLGTQSWEKLKISRFDRDIDIQQSLRAAREDPNEI